MGSVPDGNSFLKRTEGASSILLKEEGEEIKPKPLKIIFIGQRKCATGKWYIVTEDGKMHRFDNNCLKIKIIGGSCTNLYLDPDVKHKGKLVISTDRWEWIKKNHW